MGRSRGTTKKSDGPIDVNKITWGKATEKKEPVCTGIMVFKVIAGLVTLMMLGLYFLVDDTPPPDENPPEPVKPVKPARAKYVFKYTYSDQIDEGGIQTLIAGIGDDYSGPMRILAFEMTEQDPKEKNWKKWERIAKAMRFKQQFQRYQEDELPTIHRYDCSKKQEGQADLCSQLQITYGQSMAVFFKDKVSRKFDPAIRSEKQFLDSVFQWMQPPMEYIEEIDDIVDFMEDFENPIKVFLFGEGEKVQEAADGLRQLAKFARNRKANIAEHFEVEGIPKLVMYRDFEPRRLIYEGDLESIEDVSKWIQSNQLPVLPDFNEKTRARIIRKGLPVIFLYLDPTEEASKPLLAAGEKAAEQHAAEYVVCVLDAITESAIARNFGAETYPAIVSQKGQQKIVKDFNTEDPAASIQEVIDEFNAVGTEGEEDDYYYDDDEAYDEEDVDYYDDEFDDGELTDDAGSESAQKPAALEDDDEAAAEGDASKEDL